MEINKKRHGSVNPKTGKSIASLSRKESLNITYSVYHEATIWKKIQVNCTLLKMTLATLPCKHSVSIHHSDRGSQYCSKAYEILKLK